MSETLAERLLPYGIDLVDAEDRFDGNVGLYERMALKYENDDHMVALKAAMEMKDYDEAYKQAHGLKGVAGNLSFATLYQQASIVSDALKTGEAFGAAEHMEPLEAAHLKVLEGLQVLRENAS